MEIKATRMQGHSTYPLHPPGTQTLLQVSGDELTLYDRLVVLSSSLFFVGGVFWVPAVYVWAVKRFRSIPKDQKKRRARFAVVLLSIAALFAVGPHRNPTVGKWVRVHKWGLWKSWLRFFAFEVVADQGLDSIQDLLNKQAIVAISPHGIFPFGLAFAALSDSSQRAFGRFRAVVASATEMIPWVRDVLKWVNAVDASRNAVDRALSEGSRIGLAPGGIAEMFEGYPKPNCHPDDEYTIVRKGIFRMAVQHGVPIIPVYCFGNTKLLRRLQLPYVIEKLSLLFRVSIVLFFGKWGLPIPFRQKLLYVMGKPIFPPCMPRISDDLVPNTGNIDNFDHRVEEMFEQYCEEMVRIFDRHKESYGWAHKTLKTLVR